MSQKDLVYEIMKVNPLIKCGRRLGNHMFLEFKDEIAIAGKMNSFFQGSKLVFQVLSDFEETNRDLKITNWKPETQFSVNNLTPYCFGVWIDFEPREEKVSISDLDNALGQD